MLLLLLTLICVLLLVFVHKRISKCLKYWKERGIPHVEPWPLVGNMAPSIFRRKAFVHLLEEYCNRYSRQRYFGFYQFLRPTLVINDLDLIKQICIKDFDKFPDHTSFLPKESDPFWNNGVFARTGKDWHSMRTILSPAFTSGKMKAMFHLMTECAHEFVEHFEQQPGAVVTVNMKDAVTRLTNDVIASTAFGFKCNSLKQPNNEFYLIGKEAFDLDGIKGFKFFGSAISPTLMKLLKVTMFSKTVENFFRRIVKETIQYREKTGLVRPDMIHLLREAQKGTLKSEGETLNYNYGGDFKIDSDKKVTISDEDITCQAAVFFFGGYDTTAGLLCNLTYELAVNPDVQDTLIQEIDNALAVCNGKIAYETLTEMKYLEMVISETLRLWTQAIFINRKCVKPYTIQPVLPEEIPLHIDSEMDIMIPTFAIHRNPDNFPNPNKFIPERFSEENRKTIKPLSYIPFGAGPRMCIGNRFAVLEVKIAIFYLLTRFRIVPVEKTSVPFVIDKASIIIQHEHGYWLGLERRLKTRR